MRKLFVVVLALAAIVGAFGWFVGSAPSRRARGTAPGAESAGGSARPAAVLAPPPGATSEPPAPTAPPPSRREASTSDELARAKWVEGRVVFPEGTPLDEEAFVVAEGFDFADGTDHRAAVARDGSFRVAFHEKARMGRLALEARYLYLDTLVRWKRGEAQAPVVLEPRLGARLEGRLVVPEGTRVVGGRVELALTPEAGRHDVLAVRNLGNDLSFRFDALPIGSAGVATVGLGYRGPRWLGEQRDLQLRAGETRTAEIALSPGVSLAGVVLEQAGAPARGARVSARTHGAGWALQGYDRSATCGSNGVFLLDAMQPGTITLEIRHEGFETLERELFDLEAGLERTDLEFVLSSGLSISGTVRWPDGSPAKASLELTPSGPGGQLDETEGTSAADGTFSITGLGETSYRVSARALPPAKETPGAAGADREQRAHHTATIEDVPAGTRDLVLTLDAGLSLTGRVEDDLGRPLDAFRVVVRRAQEDPWQIASADLVRSFRSTGGAFELEGLSAGEWKVSADAKGHAEAPPLTVTLPGRRPLVLVAPREAVVRGRVLDPQGVPVAGARVEAQRSGTGGGPFGDFFGVFWWCRGGGRGQGER
jgi:hypothetical protein